MSAVTDLPDTQQEDRHEEGIFMVSESTLFFLTSKFCKNIQAAIAAWRGLELKIFSDSKSLDDMAYHF